MAHREYSRQRFSTSGDVFVVIRGGTVELRRGGGRGSTLCVRHPLGGEGEAQSVEVTPLVRRSDGPSGKTRPRLASIFEIGIDDSGFDGLEPVQIYVPDGVNLELSANNTRLVGVNANSLEASVPYRGSLSLDRSSVTGSYIRLHAKATFDASGKDVQGILTNDGQAPLLATLGNNGPELFHNALVTPTAVHALEVSTQLNWWSTEATPIAASGPALDAVPAL